MVFKTGRWNPAGGDVPPAGFGAGQWETVNRRVAGGECPTCSRRPAEVGVDLDVGRLLLHHDDRDDGLAAGRGHRTGRRRSSPVGRPRRGHPSHVRGEALAVELHGVEAQVDQHPDVVVGHHDVGVRQQGVDEARSPAPPRRRCPAADRWPRRARPCLRRRPDPGRRPGPRRGRGPVPGSRWPRGRAGRCRSCAETGAGARGHSGRDHGVDNRCSRPTGKHRNSLQRSLIWFFRPRPGCRRRPAHCCRHRSHRRRRAPSTGRGRPCGVGDLHPQPGDAGVDVDQVVPTAERGDQSLGLLSAPDVGTGRWTHCSETTRRSGWPPARRRTPPPAPGRGCACSTA